MARENFDAVMDVIFAHEGGFVNHPRDPGGATNMGITKRTLEAWLGRAVSVDEVKELPKETARDIYREHYWNVIRGDELPAGLDLIAMDGAVNSGPARGAKWLQAALGVVSDGKIGPKTLAAAKAADDSVIDAAIGARLAFLRSLPTWPTFGKGWSRRLTETQRAAHSMFRRVSHPDPMEQDMPWFAAILDLLANIFRRQEK